MKSIWNALNLNCLQDLTARVSVSLFISQIFTEHVGCRGTAVHQTNKISALMELNIHGKDGRWERQIRTSKVCTWLRALGHGVDWGPVGVNAAVKAVRVSELA